MGQHFVQAKRIATFGSGGHKAKLAGLFIAVIGVVGSLLSVPNVAHAACSAPSANYGTATMNVTVGAAGSYRVWSRIMAPDTTNTSYMLQVDPTSTNSCYTVGGNASMPANSWKWVDYQNGNPASKVDLTLTAGSHTLVMIGVQPSVKLDRVMLLSDTACVPSDAGTGDDCATIDTNKPTVAITAPSDAATVHGTVAVSVTASDNSVANGVAKVEFYVNGVLRDTSTTAATGSKYSFNWDTSTLPSGSYILKAVGYDASGNSNADTVTVTVKQLDTTAPSTPAGASATANSSTKITLTWQASTDAVGVTGYQILRSIGAATPTPYQQVNGSTLSFSDTPVSATTKYNYQVVALDAAGNSSKASAVTSVTTPAPTQTDTTAPSAPQSLHASAVSSNQINLSWAASTDNVAVTAYDVYRATGTGAQTKIATIPVLVSSQASGSPAPVTYGDGNLSANTVYTYSVTARDAGNNTSAKSATASATTLTKPSSDRRGTIQGTVWDKQGNELRNITVTMTLNGSKHTYSTDSKGIYHIYAVPAGNYRLRFDGNGFWNQTISTHVKANKTDVENVVMSRN